MSPMPRTEAEIARRVLTRAGWEECACDEMVTGLEELHQQTNERLVMK
jgi:hypothetical protein